MTTPDMTRSKAMYALLERLFPICRSITGNGVRQTLTILGECIPLETHEVPSGTQVFDWTVPPEWNIHDAYVADACGNRVIDFQKNNLHVVGYSIPINGRFSREELDEHLYSLPEQPSAIPYVTSYYKAHWGFCLPHCERGRLTDPWYDVVIDSTLAPGSLTYADLVIPGESEEEILISTYVCHPSLANNELSGPVVATYLAMALLRRERRRFTYRFVFVPETIGSITYLSRYKDHLKKHVVAGFVVTCVGDNAKFCYLKSRAGETLADRIVLHVLKHAEPDALIFEFTESGSDERQYCSPGINLPVGSLMRTKYGCFPEYHTSLDNLEFVSAEALAGSLEMYLRCVDGLERNHVYRSRTYGDPQLGKRGLYPSISSKEFAESLRLMINLIAYCDGTHDLLWIADKFGVPLARLVEVADLLTSHELLERVS